LQSEQEWDQVFHGRLLVGVKQLDAGDQQSASNGNRNAAEEIPVQQAVPGAYSIRLSGEVWHIRYDQEIGAFPKKGSQALGWIAKLLAAPGCSFTVADLLGDPEGKLAADALLMGECETDPEGVEAIKTRLAEIEEIAAETGGSEAMDNEKSDLLRRLQAADYGTQILNPLRKSHHNIATQIRKLRDKLSESMPKLGTYLRVTFRFEFPQFGYYPPAGTPAWES
jgi:hypothetical protein